MGADRFLDILGRVGTERQREGDASQHASWTGDRSKDAQLNFLRDELQNEFAPTTFSQRFELETLAQFYLRRVEIQRQLYARAQEGSMKLTDEERVKLDLLRQTKEDRRIIERLLGQENAPEGLLCSRDEAARLAAMIGGQLKGFQALADQAANMASLELKLARNDAKCAKSQAKAAADANGVLKHVAAAVAARGSPQALAHAKGAEVSAKRAIATASAAKDENLFCGHEIVAPLEALKAAEAAHAAIAAAVTATTIFHAVLAKVQSQTLAPAAAPENVAAARETLASSAAKAQVVAFKSLDDALKAATQSVEKGQAAAAAVQNLAAQQRQSSDEAAALAAHNRAIVDGTADLSAPVDALDCDAQDDLRILQIMKVLGSDRAQFQDGKFIQALLCGDRIMDAQNSTRLRHLLNYILKRVHIHLAVGESLLRRVEDLDAENLRISAKPEEVVQAEKELHQLDDRIWRLRQDLRGTPRSKK